MKKALTVILILIVPFLVFSHDTLPIGDMTKAIRIEYSLVIPKFDSLLNYDHLPYKKILTIKKGEVLYEEKVKIEYFNSIWYFDIDSNLSYNNLYYYQIGATKRLIKQYHLPISKIIATSKKAAHKILENPCRANQVEINEDTLLVYTTDVFGFDFHRWADVKGVALEYEETHKGIGKIKYRAVKIDTVFLPDSQLVDISTYKINDVTQFDIEEFKNIIKKNSAITQQIIDDALGQPVKNYKTKTLKGKKINSKYLEGKIQVLNFWFTKCGPCIAEIPSLNLVVEHFKNDDEIVFLSFCREKDFIEPILDKNPFDYQVCPDGAAIADKFKVPHYPTNMIIDQQGNIAAYIDGYDPDIAKTLIEEINKLKN